MPLLSLRSVRVRGARLGSYLTALVLVPVLGMLGFAAVEVHAHLRSAQDAARSETLVRDAGAAAIARAQVQNELVPAVARAVISMPALGKTLGVATGTVKGLAPSADR
ncbi:MAG TPA: hypothetical protein VM684_02155, partial [Gaiellales bacterium]|nr:hypothetical protein [Gaiellales bacterium]